MPQITAMPQKCFPPTPQSASQARQFAVTALTAWGLADAADDVRLCVSELAANAVVHAGGAPFHVRLTADDESVRVEVHDRDGGRPVRRRAQAEDTTGRGLLLVNALADAWGVREEPDGKTVWARFLLKDRVTPGPAA